MFRDNLVVLCQLICQSAVSDRSQCYEYIGRIALEPKALNEGKKKML